MSFCFDDIAFFSQSNSWKPPLKSHMHFPAADNRAVKGKKSLRSPSLSTQCIMKSFFQDSSQPFIMRWLYLCFSWLLSTGVTQNPAFQSAPVNDSIQSWMVLNSFITSPGPPSCTPAVWTHWLSCLLFLHLSFPSAWQSWLKELLTFCPCLFSCVPLYFQTSTSHLRTFYSSFCEQKCLVLLSLNPAPIKTPLSGTS